MSTNLFLIIFYFIFNKSSAYPGERILRTTKCLNCNPIDLKKIYINITIGFAIKQFHHPKDGGHHVILDQLYVSYFKAINDQDATGIDYRIALITHAYLLLWKIDQNRDRLETTKTKGMIRKSLAGHKPTNCDQPCCATTRLAELKWAPVYQHLTCGVRGVLVDGFLKYADKILLCYLLRWKYEMFKALSTKGHEYSESQPRCDNATVGNQTLEANREKVREWMLSDLVHFLPKRQNLIAYFRKVIEKNNEKDFREIWRKFSALLGGFARVAMLFDKYREELAFPFKDDFLANVYNNYFDSQAQENKWRSKIVLEKLLYTEWKSRYFETELSKNPSGKESRDNFLQKLKKYWDTIELSFWTEEKTQRKRIEKFTKFAKENKGEAAQNVDDLFMEKQEAGEGETMLLWENGPKDTTLLRAMAICTMSAVSEWQTDYERIGTKIDNLSIWQRKWVICVGKKMKRPVKYDQFLAKLHLDKIEQLIDANGQRGENLKFIQKLILKEHKQLWKELLDADGIVQLEKLLKMEYFSPVESLSESSSSDSSEKSFSDAKDKFDDQKQKAPIRTESPEHSDPEEESLEQRRNRKKMLKEAKKLRAIQKQRKEKWEKQKKVQKFIDKKVIKGIQEDSPEEEQEPIKSKKSSKSEKIDPSLEQLRKYYQNLKCDVLKFGKQHDAGTSKAVTPLENDICIEILKELKIKSLADLAEEVFMRNLYKIIENKCVEYLHISLFIRTIQAKMGTIEVEDENYGKFVEKWAEFVGMELAEIEDTHFMLDKLYFMHREMEGLVVEPSIIDCMLKIIEILEEPKMKKVGKKSEIYSAEIADEIRITQFGTYTFEQYKEELSQMQHYLDTFVVRA